MGIPHIWLKNNQRTVLLGLFLMLFIFIPLIVSSGQKTQDTRERAQTASTPISGGSATTIPVPTAAQATSAAPIAPSGASVVSSSSQ